MSHEVSNTDDIIDIRDVIARVEELREQRDGSSIDDEDTAELASLESLLRECQGNGGDEQWEGDWYPVTLVRESYFETYAQELAEDLGAIPDNAQWPCTCIDWGQAARELRMDYTGVGFGNVTYWTR